MTKLKFASVLALFAVVLAAALLLLGVPCAYAESVVEVENNNSQSKANNLELNTTVIGSIDDSGDRDWFCFTVTERGYFSINFSHEVVSASSRVWTLRLYDSDGHAWTYAESRYDVAGNSDFQSTKFGVSGGTYYVVVSGGDSYSSEKYYLKVNFAQTDCYEAENNDGKSKANVLTLNSAMHGAVTSSGDYDWYQFTLPSTGYFYISFTHINTNTTENIWKVALCDKNVSTLLAGAGNTIADWRVSGKEDMYSCNFGLARDTYYIIVSRLNSSDVEYSLTVHFTPSNSWETEGNDSKNSANSVQLNKPINGALMNSSDVDWFTFSTYLDGYISLSVNHRSAAASPWLVQLRDANSRSIIGNGAVEFEVSGASALNTSKLGLPAGTYLICVSPLVYDDMDYELTVNFTAANDWEKEPNTDGSNANELTMYNYINGVLTTPKDIDWFKFTIDEESEIRFDFLGRELDLENYVWQLKLYRSPSQSTAIHTSLVHGFEYLSMDWLTLSEGTYYLQISAAEYSDAEYRLRVYKKHDCLYEQYDATDNDYHETVCTICHDEARIRHTWQDLKILVEPTCKDEGTLAQQCEQCAMYREIPIAVINEHKWSDYVSIGEESHTRQCSVCNKTEEGEHNWNSGEVTQSATCVASGVMTFTCLNCAETKTDDIPATGIHTWGEWQSIDETQHKHSCTVCNTEENENHSFGEWTAITMATCTEAQILMRQCPDCHKREYTEGESALGHHWGEGEVTQSATCVASGVMTFTCLDCAETKTDDIPATGIHTWGEWQSIDETQHKHSCTVCNTEENESHSFGEWSLESDATCTEAQVLVRECSKCFEKEHSEGLGATGIHIWGECQSIDETQHKHSCTVCNTEENENHSFGEWIAEEEFHSKVCACGEIIRENHIFGDWQTEKEPTTSEAGEKAKYCEICAHSQHAEIPRLKTFFERWGIIIISAGVLTIVAVVVVIVMKKVKRK